MSDQQLIERTLLFTDVETVTVEELPPEIVQRATGLRPRAAVPEEMRDASMKDIVRAATAEIARELIQKALEETGGNVTHAARLLKISRKSLQIKMRDLGLRDEP